MASTGRTNLPRHEERWAMFRTADMLEIFQQYRGDAIVIPGRGGRHWVHLSTCPQRDVPLGDPAMGGHASFALGLALAQPDKKVILFDSEGDLLMNLGVLPTIAEQAPPNFYHFLLDNECYATTGGQPVPNAKNINYAGMAKAAGYAAAYRFDDLETFGAKVGDILSETGPVFIAIKVIPEIENEPIGLRQRRPSRSRAETIRDLQQELGITVR